MRIISKPILNRAARLPLSLNSNFSRCITRAVATGPQKINFNDSETAFQAKTFPALIRGYAVFRTCLVRFLVNNAETMIRQSYIYLGDPITDYALRKTFFGHFCAGQDTSDMGPTIRMLENAGIGAILDYAAEADIVEDEIRPLTPPEVQIKSRVYDYYNEDICDARAKVFESCIESAHTLKGTKDAFAAVKVTALGNPKLLERVSTAIVEIRNLFNKFDVDNTGLISKEAFKKQYETYFSGGMDVDEVFKMINADNDDSIDYVEWSNCLTIEEIHKLTTFCKSQGPLAAATLTEEERELLLVMRNRMYKIVDLADKYNVKLMIDAEHSYFQPAIDYFTHILMKKYNKNRALIFGTYQMYLTDSHGRLLDDISRAKNGDYHFACKLVRGAYMELERARAADKGYTSPIHLTKQATSDNYNAGIAYMLDKIADGDKVQLMIATHNQESIEMTIAKAAERGLGPEANIFFGQLLGMADHLTYSLGAAHYKAFKYVPYGKIKEVMPYLIRRAQENSDMLGGVGVELTMLRKEIFRRLSPFK